MLTRAGHQPQQDVVRSGWGCCWSCCHIASCCSRVCRFRYATVPCSAAHRLQGKRLWPSLLLVAQVLLSPPSSLRPLQQPDAASGYGGVICCPRVVGAGVGVGVGTCCVV